MIYKGEVPLDAEIILFLRRCSTKGLDIGVSAASSQLLGDEARSG